ncbi:MAG: hypothetical protein IPG02_17555 [Ignavibacteria bacterium]|nr:hypothetical protein [Ignavibacteria bacterium]
MNTTNAGTNWNVQNTDVNVFIRSIDFANGAKGLQQVTAVRFWLQIAAAQTGLSNQAEHSPTSIPYAFLIR